MTPERLKLEQEWQKIFNTDLPKCVHNSYIKKYIKWQKENNGFEKSIQKYLDKLVLNYETENSAFTPLTPLEIKTGTKLIRDFKGIKYEVLKTDNGFEYNGKVYKSLSAVANEITGTRWNGKKFFGLLQPEYSAEKKLTKCQVFRKETHTAALSRRSSAKLNDSDVGLQAQSAETHRSIIK